jgi:WhiB family redox-sensing transcriptional regulator
MELPDLTWLDHAACADLDQDRFFVKAGDIIDPETQAICQRCPVRPDCLRHAYRSGHQHGYFGGLSPRQRQRLTLEEAFSALGDAAT